MAVGRRQNREPHLQQVLGLARWHLGLFECDNTRRGEHLAASDRVGEMTRFKVETMAAESPCSVIQPYRRWCWAECQHRDRAPEQSKPKSTLEPFFQVESFWPSGGSSSAGERLKML